MNHQKNLNNTIYNCIKKNNLGISLTKHVKDLYAENLSDMMKETEDQHR